MTPEASNIQVAPDMKDIENSIVYALQSLTASKAAENQAEMGRQDRLSELMSVVTTGMRDRDASEINAATQSFIGTARDTARKYQGKIPFDEYAKLNAQKREIETLIKKSAADQQEAQAVMKHAMTTGHSYIDQDLTTTQIQDELKKPLMERGSFWDAVVPAFDVFQFLKKNYNPNASGGYELKDGMLVTSRSNDPETQIGGFYDTSKEFSKKMDTLYNENPANQVYGSPKEFAIQTYAPFIKKEISTAKKNPLIHTTGGGGSGSKNPRRYTFTGNESNGSYTFGSDPIIMYGIKDSETGKSINNFKITKVDKQGDRYYATGFQNARAYEFNELKDAYEKVAGGNVTDEKIKKRASVYEGLRGDSEEEKLAQYERYTTGPLAATSFGADLINPDTQEGSSRRIELDAETAAIIMDKLNSSYKKVETNSSSTPAAKTTNNAKPYKL